MNRDDAEEFTQSLGQIMAGSWRQIALAKRLGVPQALGLTTPEWVHDRLGGYVKMSIPDRRDAVAELMAEDLSQREAAEVLGVSPKTIANDIRAENSAPEPEPEPEPDPARAENSAPEPEPDPEAVERAAQERQDARCRSSLGQVHLNLASIMRQMSNGYDPRARPHQSGLSQTEDIHLMLDAIEGTSTLTDEALRTFIDGGN